MREAGEEFDERALRAHPPDNVADYERFPAAYRRDLAERLAESERATIDRFYPGELIPAGLLAPAPPLHRRILACCLADSAAAGQADRSGTQRVARRHRGIAR